MRDLENPKKTKAYSERCEQVRASVVRVRKDERPALTEIGQEVVLIRLSQDVSQHGLQASNCSKGR